MELNNRVRLSDIVTEAMAFRATRVLRYAGERIAVEKVSLWRYMNFTSYN